MEVAEKMSIIIRDCCAKKSVQGNKLLEKWENKKYSLNGKLLSIRME